jgi:hypothetical protein
MAVHFNPKRPSIKKSKNELIPKEGQRKRHIATLPQFKGKQRPGMAHINQKLAGISQNGRTDLS